MMCLVARHTMNPVMHTIPLNLLQVIWNGTFPEPSVLLLVGILMLTLGNRQRRAARQPE